MAIPPDPIEELLPQATLVVVAQVSRVVTQETQVPIPASDPKRKGGPQVPLAAQVVALEVEAVLHGDSAAAGSELQARKPAGDYSLSVGAQGPFLLAHSDSDEAPLIILGRYGPDSYRQNVIEAALQQQRS